MRAVGGEREQDRFALGRRVQEDAQAEKRQVELVELEVEDLARPRSGRGCDWRLTGVDLVEVVAPEALR